MEVTFQEFLSRLKKKVVIVGVGNRLRGDDAAGSMLAERIRNKVPFVVFDVGISPENYLEKIIREKPSTIIILDAADFQATPGESEILNATDIKTANVFSTHNASLALATGYLQKNTDADIMAIFIQPKTVAFQDSLSKEIEEALILWEKRFYEAAKEKG